MRRATARAAAAICSTAACTRRRSLNSGSAMRAGEQYALKEHLGARENFRRGHGGGRPRRRRRGHCRALRPLPRPRDVSDQRLARPGHRLWRPRARQGGVGQISQFAGDAALSQGRTLYNIADARKAAHDGARVIAVEGYVDVIAMVTAGFAATVAPLGTALTTDQLALMWRMADEPILCFDGDDAGRRAAYRALDLALPLLKPGKSLKFATLPDGQDPDDLARSGGRDAIEDVLGAARPLRMCCGRARARPARSIRRNAAPRSKRVSPKSRRRSAMNRCAAITGRISPRGCASCSRRRRCRRGGAILATGTAASGCNAGDQPRNGGRPRRGAADAAVSSATKLCRGEPAACGKPGASRPSRRHPAPRGADPASRAQLSVAAARPHGGTRRGRVPPRRYAKA